jgi:hypothetical protein
MSLSLSGAGIATEVKEMLSRRGVVVRGGVLRLVGIGGTGTLTSSEGSSRGAFEMPSRRSSLDSASSSIEKVRLGRWRLCAAEEGV